MKQITLDDSLDLTTYEKRRDDIRAAVIALKEPRRVAVGDRLTFIFENRDTVRFQVQEMVRAERMVKAEAIQAELDVYNELMPRDGELSATLMIEIPGAELIRRELDRRDEGLRGCPRQWEGGGGGLAAPALIELGLGSGSCSWEMTVKRLSRSSNDFRYLY